MISVVTAAFAPIVTKKIKTSDMTIGASSSDYIFDESICKNSVTNCSICVGNECIRCDKGYYLEENTCKQCPEGCENCESADKCLQCKDEGYFQKNGKCSKCAPGCIKCSSETSCTKCCDNCKICMVTQGCAKCEFGYFFDGNKCSVCTYKDSIASFQGTYGL